MHPSRRFHRKRTQMRTCIPTNRQLLWRRRSDFWGLLEFMIEDHCEPATPSHPERGCDRSHAGPSPRHTSRDDCWSVLANLLFVLTVSEKEKFFEETKRLNQLIFQLVCAFLFFSCLFLLISVSCSSCVHFFLCPCPFLLVSLSISSCVRVLFFLCPCPFRLMSVSFLLMSFSSCVLFSCPFLPVSVDPSGRQSQVWSQFCVATCPGQQPSCCFKNSWIVEPKDQRLRGHCCWAEAVNCISHRQASEGIWSTERNAGLIMHDLKDSSYSVRSALMITQRSWNKKSKFVMTMHAIWMLGSWMLCKP